MKRTTYVLAIIGMLCMVGVVWNVLTDTDVVLLSFDVEIGDSEEDMNLLLELLESHDIPATYFVMGEYALQYPEITKRLAKNGEVGCHTHTHPNMRKLSKEQQRVELVECVKSIKAILGDSYPVYGFRAPYHGINSDTHELLEELKFTYDASHIKNFGFLFPRSMIQEIPVSAFGPIPLSDAVLIYFPFPRTFFSFERAKSASMVSYLFHPHRAADYVDHIEALIKVKKAEGAEFKTHVAYIGLN